MTRSLTCSSALALVFVASAASADVSPQEVWASWQAMATAAGQELTVGNVADSGDAVEVSDIVIAYKDDLGGSASVTFDTLTFTDNGDGTVAVTMPESYPVEMAFPPKEDGPSALTLTVSQPGMEMTAGGSATETSYDIMAPSTTVTLDGIKGQDGKDLGTTAELALTELSAKYAVSQNGEGTVLDSSFSSKGMTLKVSGEASDGTGGGTADISFADVAGATKGNFLSAELMANMASALNSGFTMDTSLNFGAMSMNVDVTDGTGPTKIVANATGGGFVLALDKERMNYGTSLNGAKFSVSGPEIPFPQVEVAFAESGFNVMMPVSKSDVAQDFSFLTKLVDFTVSEDVWGLFDPAGTLSREPATVIVDLKGKGYWEQDIMDPSLQMEGAQPPGKLESLDLTQILAKAAGAEVSAAGGLTFDNADTTTFGGVPRPDGKITVNIKGVTKLVDNLIALGILSEDDAMGFRMGLGMFARPGAGPDELVSEVEFKDGGLFANGMQLQ
jgi:hypothetical protein